MAKLPLSPSCRLLSNIFLNKPTPISAAASAGDIKIVENPVENVTKKPSLRNLFLNKPTPLSGKNVENPIKNLKKKPKPIPFPAFIPTADCDVENIVKQFKQKSTSAYFRGNRKLYFTVVLRLAKSGHFSAVHDILDHQKKYPSIQKEPFTAHLILAYGKAKMFDHALKLFDEMPSLNCPRTVISFNALLAACIPAARFEKAIELFRELPGKLSIKPNVISYILAIRALCKMKSLDEAMLLLEEMERNGVEPSVDTFGLLLREFCHRAGISEVEKVWKLMEEKKVVPDLDCYNSLLLGMVNENRLSEAMGVLKVLEDKELKPNGATYNALVKGFVNEGNLEEVKKWYARMIDNGGVPNLATLRTVIPFACDNNDIDFAYELCKKSFGLKVTLPSELTQKVIDLLVEQSKADKAKELVELVEAKSGLVLG